MRANYNRTKAAGLNCLATLIFLLAISVSPCPAADFWIPDDAGRITHTWMADESLVMCMQGRAVVMQVRVSTDKGVSYTVRFFNVKKDYFKRIMYQVGRDLNLTVQINGQPLKFESPTTATFDGMLTFTYPEDQGVVATRKLYPSNTKPLVIEQWRLRNNTTEPIKVTISGNRREVPGAFRGKVEESGIIVELISPAVKSTIRPGEALWFSQRLQCKLASYPDIKVDLDAEHRDRRTLAEAAFRGPGRLETPDPTLDLAFALQKFHVLENPVDTYKGVITHNSSLQYSPGIWANDPVEYSSPIFPFFGDPQLNEASLNMYRIWQDYCQKNGIDPFPGSFEHPDLRLVQRHRGDNAMVLYALPKFLLFLGDRKAAEELWPLVEFSAKSVEKHKTADGIIASRTDEMEGRYPTGTANLSTSALAYGGYCNAARLAHALGKIATAKEFEKRADALRKAIEIYFGADVEGFRTYRYFKGNTTLRGWILLPLAMGITERQQSTVDALLSDKLWPNRLKGGDLLAESTRETEWARETYYALRVLFKAGRTEEALKITQCVVKAQIFGNEGPYPDEDAIDMLCPGSLYPRVFTEGMFGIVPTGLESFECTPWLPKAWPKMALRDMRAFGHAWDMVVERDGDQQKITVSNSDEKVIFTDVGPAGKTYSVSFKGMKNDKDKTP
jgi:hypothetical protein